MKRSILFVICCLLMVPGAMAQAPCYIFLKDKGSSTGLKPQEFLSAKSLLRRQKQCISLNETDYPLAPEYLARLEELGVNTGKYSKWLNMVAAPLSMAQFKAVADLPFVSRVVKAAPMQVHFAEYNLEAFDSNAYAHVAPYRIQLHMMGADVLHANGYRGKGITIALMDDGFNRVNEIAAFKHLFDENRIIATRDFVFPGGDVYSTGRHGTLVLSQIAAIWPGHLFGSGYDASFILAHTENDTSESRHEEVNWAMAAEWADSIGADIFSTSLGYSKGMTDSLENHTYAEMNGDSTIITIAADLAASKGILVVNSAGNERNNSWHFISAPSDGDSVLCVGAVDSSGTLTNFSSVGPSADGRLKPDVVCMGGRTVVVGTNGLLYKASGTSFSCPLMSGLAASLWQSTPHATSMEIFNALVQSADRYSFPDTLYGNGIPDGGRAFWQLNGYLLPYFVDSARLLPNGTGVFPNPASKYFRVIVENRNQVAQISVRIWNSLGQLIDEGPMELKTDYNEKHFDPMVMGMNPGVYFIEVLEAQTHTLLRQRLVITR